MFESMTFQNLLNRMVSFIKNINSNIDSREGSVVYDATASNALETANVYLELDNLRKETFISTASREGKLNCCREQGIDVSIFEAHAGSFLGEFNVEVNLGSRWNLDLYNYQVTEYIGQNNETQLYQYQLLCETVGTAPNVVTGNLTPIDDPPRGLSTAKIIDCLIQGENETSDADIEKYYFTYISRNNSDGNVAQYELWCSEYPNVGNYKIFPCWNGKNTVKVSILDSENKSASEELIEEFQEYLDPNSEGMGNGKAPIGSIVTVTTATTLPINISAKVSLKNGVLSESSIKPALQAYLADIAYTSNTVSYIAIAAKMLNAEGIANVSDVIVNDGTSDITLKDEEIPELGELDITVVS